jgi:hypothetical protein
MILHFRPLLIGQSWHRYVLSDQLQDLLTMPICSARLTNSASVILAHRHAPLSSGQVSLNSHHAFIAGASSLRVC